MVGLTDFRLMRGVLGSGRRYSNDRRDAGKTAMRQKLSTRGRNKEEWNKEEWTMDGPTREVNLGERGRGDSTYILVLGVNVSRWG